MKKVFLSLILAALMLAATVTPVLAWGGGSADTDVDLGEVTVTGDLTQYSTVVVEGTITITSKSDVKGFLTAAYAEGDTGYSITDPSGQSVSSGSTSQSNLDLGLFNANADASFIYSWSESVWLDSDGIYNVLSYGSAYSQWWNLIFLSGHSSSDKCDLFSFRVEPVDTDVLGGEAGRFVVMAFDYRYFQGTRWQGGWDADPQITKEDTSVVGQHKGIQFKIEIPAGTEVSLPGGARVTSLILNPDLSFSPSQMDFDQPVTVYVMDNGEWIKIMSFTSIRGGQPVQ